MAKKLPTPRILANTLDKVARAAIGKDWSLYASLLSHWPEIVGEEHAKNTTPSKITFPKGKKESEKWAAHKTGGTLHIAIPRGLSMEMNFLSETIKSRINGFFGYPAIEKIVFDGQYETPEEKEAPSPTPLSTADKTALQDATKDIENEDLRDVLQSLGESVITQEPSKGDS